MSVKSWFKEYYPTGAAKAVRSDLMAAKHSLRKWRGLTEEALAKHGLTERPPGVVGTLACALCQRHWVRTSDCVTCPIVEQTSRCRAFSGDGPYGDYINHDNPFPMIKVLEECVEKLKDQ